MSRSILVRISLVFAGALALQAQTSPQTTFEVASIRTMSRDERPTRLGVSILPGGRVVANWVTLRGLISYAYDVKDYQVAEGPAWAGSERYAIVAKFESESTRTVKEIRQMFQSLLASRFSLKLDRATKDGVRMYSLVLAKGGPKLKESPVGANSSMRASNGFLIASKISMARLASVLTARLERPVVDKTGLTKEYDIRLEAQEMGFLPIGSPDAPVDPNEVSIFVAIQEQLGLKLESKRGPIEILNIVHAEQPSEN